ncbi:hypothetical protein A1O3_03575 [Capronia epimyces CBS 606.96]|uniref:Uncharacterized protein n=1 Tax=Capronia epimyces CBS 606.96 TaxID=1182542 RepID=W9Y1D2_9EURO|nr:uncharacterized protein A1O3_03575 [Capronia epimyces CBS 606.96]EXJ86622.1 hypothetical protein A1O3_03575 [Capronia epimyces CBS 606.96]
MCFKYLCVSCKLDKHICCDDFINSDQTWCNVTTETPWGGQKLRCPTCETIKGVIWALEVLVFREPYLLTEGMAGAPKKGAWEEEEKRGGGADADEDEWGELDGFTKEERERVRAEAEASVMKRWGLMRAEQSAQGEGEDGEEVVEMLAGAPGSK